LIAMNPDALVERVGNAVAGADATWPQQSMNCTTPRRSSSHPANAIVAPRTLRAALTCCVIVAMTLPIARADSSTPRLAAYYDRYLAICAGDAYAWTGEDTPKKVMRGVVQVGVGRSDSYALAGDGRLQAWTSDSRDAVAMLDGVQSFAAGSSGVLAIKADGSLWRVERTGSFGSGRWRSAVMPVAANAKAASVGDGTDYYVTADGDLYAQGNAQRGQYGDGRLEGTASFARVTSGVRDIRSHTGHAILLDERGEVQGTGGNIYGPLGRHGLGDKAVRWGPVFGPAIGIATGASHSLAFRADGTLWTWGRNEGPDPRQVLADVIGMAAGSDSSLALTKDGSLWQWRTGARPRKVLDCGP
jgi:alpha-tubulin suppressor-like RCC1 family protein